MIVTCDDERWKYVGQILIGLDIDAPCGRTFDDTECSTICPHDPFPPKLSEEELQRLFNTVNTGKESN